MRYEFLSAADRGTRAANRAVQHVSSGNACLTMERCGLSRSAARVFGACAVLLIGGCGYTGDAEVEEETVQAASSPPPVAEESEPKPPARSAYGKAMEAAHRLEDKVDAYNKKLEQAADDAFK